MAKAKKKETLTPEERLQAVLVPDWEQPYKVPENWCWIHLLDSFENCTDSKKKIPQKEYLQDGKIAVVDQGQNLIGGYTNDREMIFAGNVPVIIFGDHTRCIKYIDFPFAQGADGIKVLKPKQFFNEKAFYYAFQTVDIPNMGYRRHFPLFDKYAIPVPPLSEQQRIVDRIESLFTKLDEAKQKAQDALNSFETRKAAILHKAFTGELTAQWRKEHGVRIESWKNVSVSEICHSLKYGTSKKSVSQGKVVVIRMGNLQDGEIRWDDLAYSNDEEDIEKYRLFSGDVLFNRTNSSALVGKTSIYRGDYPAIYAGYLIKLDYDHSRIIGDFLNYSLNTIRAKKYYNLVKTDGVNQSNINFPKRKYNYCEEGFTPVYLLSILCGQKSFEKSYLIKACHFDKVKYVDMVVNTNKVEQIFGRGRFEGDVPTGLYYLTDFIDYRFTDLLRRGFMYSSNGKSYFQITNIDSVNIDSIAILEFFEKLYSLFETRFEVTVTQGESNVKCSEMSEGQRQLIKILGMLGICKTEDCLVLMDEPDAYMNPRWKYEIKETMDNSLRDAINTQAIVATHDPLVINGVPKEFIRIFTHNENLVSNNGYYFTKVIVPTEDTEGMGIDGLLQSEYYGLSSVLDSETKDKMDEKHRLLIKKKDGTITDNEKYKLLELTNDLENMSFTRNIPTDSYYDEYVAAMHKIYSERPHVNLSAEDIAERNAKAEEILKGLLEK